MIYTITLNPTIDRTMRFPQLVIGELNRASATRIDLSGKGVNVSLALRALGIESVCTGLAAGISGQLLVAGLQAQGYTCLFDTIDGETRSNVTVIDEATGITTKLNEAGPTVTADDLATFEQHLFARVQPGDVCVFSGNLPPGAPVDTYARLIAAARAREVVTVLDTSGEALLAGAAAQPDLLKPNTAEAATLTGLAFDTVGQWEAGLQAILALGPRRVLLSADSRGAAYADGEDIWLAQPPAITEVSAVGAGDALLAGALWSWQQHRPSDEIARWAVATGTAAATIDGSAMPTLDRVRLVYAQTAIRRLRMVSCLAGGS